MLLRAPRQFLVLSRIASSGHRPPAFLPQRLAHFWRRAFGRHLLVTNAVIGCGGIFAADLLSQSFELFWQGRRAGEGFDWLRTTRLSLAGLLFATPMHYWLVFLERCFPGNAVRQVAKKVALEQGLVVPLCLPLFVGAMAFSRGASWAEFKAEAPAKIGRLWLLEVAIWPAAQAVNFRLVPFHYRFAFANSVAFLEDILISYVFHLDDDGKRKGKENEQVAQTGETR